MISANAAIKLKILKFAPPLAAEYQWLYCDDIKGGKAHSKGFAFNIMRFASSSLHSMPSFGGSLFVFVCLAATAIAATAPAPPYYIITNAETPSLDRPGLTPVGKQRAEGCIPEVGAFSILEYTPALSMNLVV